MNPAALTPEELARLLAQAARADIRSEHILADIRSGAPVNPDGTVNLVTYTAWLLQERG